MPAASSATNLKAARGRAGQGQVSQWIALSSQQAFKRRSDAAEAQAVPEWCPGAILTWERAGSPVPRAVIQNAELR